VSFPERERGSGALDHDVSCLVTKCGVQDKTPLDLTKQLGRSAVVALLQDARKISKWVQLEGDKTKCTQFYMKPDQNVDDLRKEARSQVPRHLDKWGVDPVDLAVCHSGAVLPTSTLLSQVNAGDSSDNPFVLWRRSELEASGPVQARLVQPRLVQAQAPPPVQAAPPPAQAAPHPLPPCPRKGCSNKTCPPEDRNYKEIENATKHLENTYKCLGTRKIRGRAGKETCNTNLHLCCGNLWPDDTSKSYRHHLRQCHSQQGSDAQHDAPINKRLHEQSQHDAPNKRPCSPRPSTLPNAYGIQEPSVDLDPRPPLGLPSPLPTSSHGSPNSAPSDVGLPPPDDITAAPNAISALPSSTPTPSRFDDTVASSESGPRKRGGQFFPDDGNNSYNRHVEGHSQQDSCQIVPQSVAAVQSQHDAQINKRRYVNSQHDTPNKRPRSPRPSTLGTQEPSVDLDHTQPRPSSPTSSPPDFGIVGLSPPDDIAPNAFSPRSSTSADVDEIMDSILRST